MYRGRVSGRQLGKWIQNYIINNANEYCTVGKKVKVIRELERLQDGSVVKKTSDGWLTISTIFQSSAVSEAFEKYEDGEPNWRDALLILKEFTIKFQCTPKEPYGEYILLVHKFSVWDLQEGFSLKYDLTNCMWVPEIRALADKEREKMADESQHRRGEYDHLLELMTQFSQSQSQRAEEPGPSSIGQQQEPGPASRGTNGEEPIPEDVAKMQEAYSQESKDTITDSILQQLKKPFTVEEFLIPESQLKILEGLSEWQSDSNPSISARSSQCASLNMDVNIPRVSLSTSESKSAANSSIQVCNAKTDEEKAPIIKCVAMETSVRPANSSIQVCNAKTDEEKAPIIKCVAMETSVRPGTSTCQYLGPIVVPVTSAIIASLDLKSRLGTGALGTAAMPGTSNQPEEDPHSQASSSQANCSVWQDNVDSVQLSDESTNSELPTNEILTGDCAMESKESWPMEEKDSSMEDKDFLKDSSGMEGKDSSPIVVEESSQSVVVISSTETSQEKVADQSKRTTTSSINHSDDSLDFGSPVHHSTQTDHPQNIASRLRRSKHINANSTYKETQADNDKHSYRNSFGIKHDKDNSLDIEADKCKLGIRPRLNQEDIVEKVEMTDGNSEDEKEKCSQDIEQKVNHCAEMSYWGEDVSKTEQSLIVISSGSVSFDKELSDNVVNSNSKSQEKEHSPVLTINSPVGFDFSGSFSERQNRIFEKHKQQQAIKQNLDAIRSNLKKDSNAAISETGDLAEMASKTIGRNVDKTINQEHQAEVASQILTTDDESQDDTPNLGDSSSSGGIISPSPPTELSYVIRNVLRRFGRSDDKGVKNLDLSDTSRHEMEPSQRSTDMDEGSEKIKGRSKQTTAPLNVTYSLSKGSRMILDNGADREVNIDHSTSVKTMEEDMCKQIHFDNKENDIDNDESHTVREVVRVDSSGDTAGIDKSMPAVFCAESAVDYLTDESDIREIDVELMDKDNAAGRFPQLCLKGRPTQATENVSRTRTKDKGKNLSTTAVMDYYKVRQISEPKRLEENRVATESASKATCHEKTSNDNLYDATQQFDVALLKDSQQIGVLNKEAPKDNIYSATQPFEVCSADLDASQQQSPIDKQNTSSSPENTDIGTQPFGVFQMGTQAFTPDLTNNQNVSDSSLSSGEFAFLKVPPQKFSLKPVQGKECANMTDSSQEHAATDLHKCVDNIFGFSYSKPNTVRKNKTQTVNQVKMMNIKKKVRDKLSQMLKRKGHTLRLRKKADTDYVAADKKTSERRCNKAYVDSTKTQTEIEECHADSENSHAETEETEAYCKEIQVDTEETQVDTEESQIDTEETQIDTEDTQVDSDGNYIDNGEILLDNKETDGKSEDIHLDSDKAHIEFESNYTDIESTHNDQNVSDSSLSSEEFAFLKVPQQRSLLKSVQGKECAIMTDSSQEHAATNLYKCVDKIFGLSYSKTKKVRKKRTQTLNQVKMMNIKKKERVKLSQMLKKKGHTLRLRKKADTDYVAAGKKTKQKNKNNKRRCNKTHVDSTKTQTGIEECHADRENSHAETKAYCKEIQADTEETQVDTEESQIDTEETQIDTEETQVDSDENYVDNIVTLVDNQETDGKSEEIHLDSDEAHIAIENNQIDNESSHSDAEEIDMDNVESHTKGEQSLAEIGVENDDSVQDTAGIDKSIPVVSCAESSTPSLTNETDIREIDATNICVNKNPEDNDDREEHSANTYPPTTSETDVREREFTNISVKIEPIDTNDSWEVHSADKYPGLSLFRSTMQEKAEDTENSDSISQQLNKGGRSNRLKKRKLNPAKQYGKRAKIEPIIGLRERSTRKMDEATNVSTGKGAQLPAKHWYSLATKTNKRREQLELRKILEHVREKRYTEAADQEKVCSQANNQENVVCSQANNQENVVCSQANNQEKAVCSQANNQEKLVLTKSPQIDKVTDRNNLRDVQSIRLKRCFVDLTKSNVLFNGRGQPQTRYASMTKTSEVENKESENLPVNIKESMINHRNLERAKVLLRNQSRSPQKSGTCTLTEESGTITIDGRSYGNKDEWMNYIEAPYRNKVSEPKQYSFKRRKARTSMRHMSPRRILNGKKAAETFRAVLPYSVSMQPHSDSTEPHSDSTESHPDLSQPQSDSQPLSDSSQPHSDSTQPQSESQPLSELTLPHSEISKIQRQKDLKEMMVQKKGGNQLFSKRKEVAVSIDETGLWLSKDRGKAGATKTLARQLENRAPAPSPSANSVRAVLSIKKRVGDGNIHVNRRAYTKRREKDMRPYIVRSRDRIMPTDTSVAKRKRNIEVQPDTGGATEDTLVNASLDDSQDEDNEDPLKQFLSTLVVNPKTDVGRHLQTFKMQPIGSGVDSEKRNLVLKKRSKLRHDNLKRAFEKALLEH